MYETKINELTASRRPGKGFKNYLDSLLIKRIMKSVEPVRGNVSGNLEMLEIGTGSGQLAYQMLQADVSLQYLGVEPTNSLRAATTELLSPYGSRARLIDSSLPQLVGTSDNSFDVCVMFHLLEHAPDQYQAHQWLSAVFSKVKQGGRVIIVCPNLFDYKTYFYDGDWSHGYPTTSRRIELLGIDAGFRSIEATDLRGNSNNLLVKGILRVGSFCVPTGLINFLGQKLLKVSYLGMGLQAALFWRNCWVVLEKPSDSVVSKNN